MARAEALRAALLLVARKEALRGLSMLPNVAAEPGVKVVGVFPPDTHRPIIYPIALTAGKDTRRRSIYSIFKLASRQNDLREARLYSLAVN